MQMFKKLASDLLKLKKILKHCYVHLSKSCILKWLNVQVLQSSPVSLPSINKSLYNISRHLWRLRQGQPSLTTFGGNLNSYRKVHMQN
jgi:hypothetical protein